MQISSHLLWCFCLALAWAQSDLLQRATKTCGGHLLCSSAVSLSLSLLSGERGRGDGNGSQFGEGEVGWEREREKCCGPTQESALATPNARRKNRTKNRETVEEEKRSWMDQEVRNPKWRDSQQWVEQAWLSWHTPGYGEPLTWLSPALFQATENI